MKLLIADDEPPARDRLASLLREMAVGQIVAEVDNGRDALDAARRTAPHVALLDIRMPLMDGLEVARALTALEYPPAVIFTTAFDAHALEAFDAHAVDYLLKPIRRLRLEAALARARRLTPAQLDKLQALPSHLSATVHGTLQRVAVDEVRCLLAEDKYVTAHFPGGQLLIEESLHTLETTFAGRFLRVHRNALVALAYMQGLETAHTGGHHVRLSGIDTRVQVSRRLLARVKRRLAAQG